MAVLGKIGSVIPHGSPWGPPGRRIGVFFLRALPMSGSVSFFIDGFRGKWLDYEALCKHYLSFFGAQVANLHYFPLMRLICTPKESLSAIGR